MRPIELRGLLSTRLKGRSVIQQINVLVEHGKASLCVMLEHNGRLDVRFERDVRAPWWRRVLSWRKFRRLSRRKHDWEDQKQRWLLERIWLQVAYWEMACKTPTAIFCSPAAWNILEDLKTAPGEGDGISVEGIPCRVIPWLRGRVAVVG